jgi:wyosine [tRNA(Phe)-imidazoG37] synthetase (radical SAM superfamily)
MNNQYLFDGCKLLWHMERVNKHYKLGEKVYPLHIDIGATKLCNAKCVYCYGIKQVMNGNVIQERPLLQLFNDAPDLGIKSITVTGDGEPTLNPAMYKALFIGAQKGLDIGFATNGIALDEEKLRVILSTCTWLRFNLSAIGELGYKSIHGVPKWECVQANIKLATALKEKYDYKCTIGLQMVLIPDALKYVMAEAKFAKENHLDYFVIKQYSDPGCKSMSQCGLSW